MASWKPVENGIAHEGPCGMQDGPAEPDELAAVFWIEPGKLLGVEIQNGKGFATIALPDNLRLCELVEDAQPVADEWRDASVELPELNVMVEAICLAHMEESRYGRNAPVWSAYSTRVLAWRPAKEKEE